MPGGCLGSLVLPLHSPECLTGSSQTLFMAILSAEETCDRTRFGRCIVRPDWAGRSGVIGTEVERRKLILPNHRVQIDRSFSIQAVPKDRFQLRDSSGQVRISLLRGGLTCRNLLEFALPLGRLLCGSVLSLEAKRFLPTPDAMSTLLASQVHLSASAPEHGRYRSCRDTYMTRCVARRSIRAAETRVAGQVRKCQVDAAQLWC